MGLFSKKKKEAEANPYADVAVAAPYPTPLTPYQQARNDLALGKPASLPSNPRFGPAAVPNPTSPSILSPSVASSKSGGVTTDSSGSTHGYGSDRYSSTANSGLRTGGYGGFDEQRDALLGGASRRAPPRPTSHDAAVGQSSALFDDAHKRYDIRQQPGSVPHPQPKPAADDEYGGYGSHRELTAEEKDQQEVDGIHDEISRERDETIATLERSKALGENAVIFASATLAKMGEQTDRLHNTQQKLNEAAIQSKDSADKTKELKQLNRSMFVPVAGNPFTRKKREQLKDEATLARHQSEKDDRSKAIRARYQSNTMAEQQFNSLSKAQSINPKYDFERDVELGPDAIIDDGESAEERRKEAIIDQGIDQLHNLTSSLRQIAVFQGETLDRQISQIETITEQTNTVDDRVRINREKLNRIR